VTKRASPPPVPSDDARRALAEAVLHLAPLGAEALAALAGLTQPRAFPAGTMLLRAGQRLGAERREAEHRLGQGAARVVARDRRGRGALRHVASGITHAARVAHGGTPPTAHPRDPPGIPAAVRQEQVGTPVARREAMKTLPLTLPALLLGLAAACSSGGGSAKVPELGDFDTSCQADSDCLAVYIGTPACCAEDNAAINKSDQAKYEAEMAAQGAQTCNEACVEFPSQTLACTQGKCTLTTP
jgi:hypothetical protein